MFIAKKVSAATTDEQAEFLNKAAKQAVRAAKKYGTYPSVMIAQAIVESGWGQSGLAVNANNLFGMKLMIVGLVPLILLRRVKKIRTARVTTSPLNLENTIHWKNHSKTTDKSCVKVFHGNHFATRVPGSKTPITMLKLPSFDRYLRNRYPI